MRRITIGDWLEAHSRWNQLRNLGSSNLVRVSVLMPAFGYMLLLNENITQYLTVKYDGWVFSHLHVPSDWRIWLLFYGSFLFAFATLLYSYFCPEEVKRYSSSFEMADGEAKYQGNLGQFQIVQKRVIFAYAPSRHSPVSRLLSFCLGGSKSSRSSF